MLTGCGAFDGDIGEYNEFNELDALFKSLIACKVLLELFSDAENENGSSSTSQNYHKKDMKELKTQNYHLHSL